MNIIASGNIRGLTIEIGGDTRNLESALNSVNTQTKSLQSELKAVERGLKLDPSNIELVRQRQELLTQSISDTSERLGILRTAQAQVQQQYDSGEIPIEQYRAFQRELQTTEGNLNRLQNSLNAIDGEQERLGQSTRDLQTLFDATGTSINDFSSALGTRLTSAIRDGSASADQLDRAIRIVGQQALGSSTDIDQLRTALRQIDDGGSIQQVRQDLSRLAQDANEAGDAVNGFGDQLTQVAGGLAAGGGIAGIISQALDVSTLDTKIDITLALDDEGRAAVREATNLLKAYGVEGEEALEGIRRQYALNTEASNEANNATIKAAGAISAAYSDIDFKELIQETNEISSIFGITADESLGLVNNLLRVGFPPDQLDIISEYGDQLIRAGYSAEEIQQIFAAGVDTGTYNIDQLLDGLKEGRIVLSEFGAGVDDATAELISNVGISTQQLQTWGAAVAGGGEAGKAAFEEAAQAVVGIDDAVQRNAVGVALFGTLYEEQGDKITSTILNASDQVVSLDANQKALNQTVDGLDSSPAVLLSTAMTNLQTALKPVLDFVAVLIAQVATFASENIGLVAAITAIVTTLGILAGAFVVLLPAIGGLVTALPILTAGFAAISAPIVLTVTAIGALGAALIAAYNESETFRSGVSTVFESIQSVATTVFQTVADFIGSQLQVIRSFWDENGAAILQAAETAFNGIMAVVDFVMPAIQFVIDYVWTAIKNVITGALDVIMGAVKTFTGILNGDFSTFWKGIQQIFSGAIDLIVGLMSLSFVGGIRNLVTNLFKTLTTTVKTQWTTIANTFKSFASSIPKTVGDLSTATINTFRTLGTTTVNLVKTMATNLVSAIKDLPQRFLQVGKDIVNGMVNGIKSIDIVDTVKGLANSVLDTAKNVLGIKSPSREFMKIGDFVGQGLVIGIDSTIGDVEKSSERLAEAAIPDITGQSESAISELQALRNEINEIAQLTSDDRLAIERRYSDQIEDIQRERAEKLAKYVELEQSYGNVYERDEYLNQYNQLGNTIDELRAKTQQELKEFDDVLGKRFDLEKKYVEDVRKLNRLSLNDQIKLYEGFVNQYESGTEERIFFEGKLGEARKEIYDKLNKANEEYAQKINDSNKRLVDGEKALNDAYEESVKSRTDSLFGFVGLFDKVEKKSGVTGARLLRNLQGQVDTFKRYQENLKTLTTRGLSEDVLEELRKLGPDAATEIAALTTLSDAELQQYSALFQERYALARQQAEIESVGLKDDTIKAIEELRRETAIELDEYADQWRVTVESINKVTVDIFDATAASTPEIGAKIIQGLQNGLSDKAEGLYKQVQSIADRIRATIQSALDFAGSSSANLSDSIGNAANSLSNSAIVNGNANGSTSNSTVDNSRTFAPNVTINTTDPGTKALDSTLRRLAFQF